MFLATNMDTLSDILQILFVSLLWPVVFSSTTRPFPAFSYSSITFGFEIKFQAEMLLGFSGLKSIPGPELPNFDFLERIQEENRKKYEANDSKFKSSALLQELLKRSKANAERHKQEIQDKYCLRGAEMGVGDCSTIGMSREESEAFIEMLRKKVADN